MKQQNQKDNMSTTTEPEIIGHVNGVEVILHEGRGENPSALEYKGRNCSQGFADIVHGQDVNEVYIRWYESQRRATR